MGCYLHGLFAADQFRAAFISELGQPVAASDYGQSVEDTLDALVSHLTEHFDLEQLLALAGDV
jgi:adenosylcobyric acid synthase